jgi:hypothetical protein
MDISEQVRSAARILGDRFRNGSVREKYWSTRKSAARWGMLLRRENRDFARLVAADHLRFHTRTVKPVAGETRERMRAAVDWLLRAQDATPDRGISLGCFPCEPSNGTAWRGSYPETTGYIIVSLLEYAARYGEPEVRRRAIEAALWETEVQMPSGAVQGGPVCPPESQVAAVFNTGMVLQGYVAAYRESGDPRILAAGRRAADFLVGDLGEDGHFRSHGRFVREARVKTYNCLCAWALHLFSEVTGERRYRDAAIRSIEAAVGRQQPNGWFADNCLDRPEAPLLHTIGYTLQGILEVGILAGEARYVEAVRRGTDPVLARMRPNGHVAGRFYRDWVPAARWSCLTGNAQLAVVCYRLHEITGESRYRDAATRLMNYLKALQRLDRESTMLNGAIAGSFPILGGYMTGGYPNWATKYFLDGLMLQDRLGGEAR